MKVSFVTRLAIARISEDIILSPKARKEFLEDPQIFISKTYGVKDVEEFESHINNLKEVLASGFCCGGCGCSASDSIDRVINPGLREFGFRE